MNVVCVPADKIDKNISFPRVFPNMSEDFRSDFVFQEWFAVFGRPDEMYPNFYVGHILGRFWLKQKEFIFLNSAKAGFDSFLCPPAEAGGNSFCL